MKSQELAGKVAIVTGGAGGLGQATAEVLVAEGATVVVADVDVERGAQVAEGIGDAAAFKQTDVSDADQVQALVDFAAPHPSDARTTLAVITSRGRKVANDATRDLNTIVYGTIGLSERKRTQLVDLLAELRAHGNEFDVERSDELIGELASRQARSGRRSRRNGAEVA